MKIFFGPWVIAPSQIFFESRLSYGVVNLKPIVPGHVLVISKRIVPRFGELSSDEVIDLYSSVHTITKRLEVAFGVDAFNIAMQDGVNSGQSVPHVHVHILPRRPNDFRHNDDVHKEIENQMLHSTIKLPLRTRLSYFIDVHKAIRFIIHRGLL
jgi:bis(5'-adenosyl)-triphosphatase